MPFRNLSFIEIKELASLIDSHSYLLQEHFGSDLPFERKPCSNYIPKPTKKEIENQERIKKTINAFTKRNNI